MTILLVDKNSIRRYGTMLLTKEVTDQTNLYEASNDVEMFETLRDQKISHLVYHYSIDKSLCETIRHIKQINKDLKVLLLTDNNQCMLSAAFFYSGAHGLIPVDAEISKFKRGLRSFFQYGKYVPDYLKKARNRFLSTPKKTTDLSLQTILSKKEYIVLGFIIQGIPLRQIAKKMNVAPTTINTFKARIYRKLLVNNMNDVSAILNISKLIA